METYNWTLKAYEKEQFLGDGDSHSDSRADGGADRAGNNELHGLRSILIIYGAKEQKEL